MKNPFLQLITLILISYYSQGQNIENSFLIPDTPVGNKGNMRITAKHIDKDGNFYLASMGSYSQCANYSGCYLYILTKLSPQGELLWEKKFIDDNPYTSVIENKLYGSYINGISSDEEGNVYVGGNYGSTTACYFGDFKTVNGDYRMFDIKSFIGKINPENGEYLWLRYSWGESDGAITDISYKNGFLWCAYSQNYSQTLVSRGNSNPTYTLEGYTGILKLDTTGNILKSFNGSGTTDSRKLLNYYQPFSASTVPNRSIVLSPKLGFDEMGHIFLVGISSTNLIFGADTISLSSIDYADGFYHFYNGIYVAVCDTASGWINAFFTPHVDDSYFRYWKKVPSFAISPDGMLYQSISRYYVDGSISDYPIRYKFDINRQPELLDSGQIWKTDPFTGKLIWKQSFGPEAEIIGMHATNNCLYFSGNFKSRFNYKNDEIISQDQSFSDIFFGNISSNGTFNYVQSAGSLLFDKTHGQMQSGGNIFLLGFSEYYLNVNNQPIFSEYDASWIMELSNSGCEVITGNQKDKESENIKIYPQPAANKLIIEGIEEDMDWAVFNSFGIFISRGNGPEVNLTSLPTGLYILDLKGQKLKFIKE